MKKKDERRGLIIESIHVIIVIYTILGFLLSLILIWFLLSYCKKGWVLNNILAISSGSLLNFYMIIAQGLITILAVMVAITIFIVTIDSKLAKNLRQNFLISMAFLTLIALVAISLSIIGTIFTPNEHSDIIALVTFTVTFTLSTIFVIGLVILGGVYGWHYICKPITYEIKREKCRCEGDIHDIPFKENIEHPKEIRVTSKYFKKVLGEFDSTFTEQFEFRYSKTNNSKNAPLGESEFKYDGTNLQINIKKLKEKAGEGGFELIIEYYFHRLECFKKLLGRQR